MVLLWYAFDTAGVQSTHTRVHWSCGHSSPPYVLWLTGPTEPPAPTYACLCLKLPAGVQSQQPSLWSNRAACIYLHLSLFETACRGAINAYTRALELQSQQPFLWSNRAACTFSCLSLFETACLQGCNQRLHARTRAAVTAAPPMIKQSRLHLLTLVSV
jgi:hypothetical protein